MSTEEVNNEIVQGGDEPRKDKVLASANNSLDTDDLDNPNVDEDGDLADRLNSGTDQGVSGERGGVEDRNDSDFGNGRNDFNNGNSRNHRANGDEDDEGLFPRQGMEEVLILTAYGIVFGFLAALVGIYILPLLPTRDSGGEPDSFMDPEQYKGEIHWLIHYNVRYPLKPVLTEEDIKYIEGGPFLLVIVGHVFDVSKGEKMYKKGTGYHGLIGRDASRAFVSRKFDEEDLTPDLQGLTPKDYITISGILNFHFNHKDYKFVGVLKGWFFDEEGEGTEKLHAFIGNFNAAMVEERAKRVRKEFPACNVEWSAEKGSRLWCSDASGGVQRTWVGFPRLFDEGEGSGARCACVQPKYLKDPRVKEYEGCPGKSVECFLREQ